MLWNFIAFLLGWRLSPRPGRFFLPDTICELCMSYSVGRAGSPSALPPHLCPSGSRLGLDGPPADATSARAGRVSVLALSELTWLSASYFGVYSSSVILLLMSLS